MASRSPGLFRTDASAAILIGTIAGMFAAHHAGFPRHYFLSSIFLAPMAFMLGPVIAARSVVRLFLAVLCAGLFVFLLVSALICVNGRESLPLAVWGPLGPSVMVPGPNAFGSWQTAAIVYFVIMLVYFDAGLVLIRRKQTADLPPIKRAVAAFGAIIGAVLPCLLLYWMSWAARVSGTFCLPLYSQSELAFSMLTYFLIFPLNPWLTIVVHDRLLDVFRARKEEQKLYAS